MTGNESYPTDEFGRADGRNYHYKIPLDDKRALSKLRVADKVKGRWFEKESSASRDGKLDGCIHVQTKDDKGPISGLSEYEYSKEWEYPFGPGRMENLRVRPNTSGGGGIKVNGTVPAYGGAGFRYDLEVSFVSELTMSEARDMTDEAYDTITNELHWAEQEAHEKRREAIAEERRNCNHEHSVEFDEPKAGERGMIEGYCEDCGEEFLA